MKSWHYIGDTIFLTQIYFIQKWGETICLQSNLIFKHIQKYFKYRTKNFTSLILEKKIERDLDLENKYKISLSEQKIKK